MREILDSLDRLRATERRVAMATLVATRGTSPKKEGAKLWVGERGRILGAVTIGGCVDARAIEAAEDVLRTGKATVLSVDLGEADARELGLTCAGAVDVLVEPVDLARSDDPVLTAYGRIRARLDEGGCGAVVTPLTGAEARLVLLDDGAGSGTLGDAALDEEAASQARDLMRRGVSRTVVLGAEGAALPAFIEVHAPPATLVVFGAGHIAVPLVRFAHGLGMRTIVVDARERYANREAFPDADEIRVGISSEIARRLRYGASTFVVLVAHDYKYDLPVLREVAGSDAAYVGLLGSRRRGETLLALLAEDGVPPAALARIRVPVGLDIGAESAPELALSILAEALAVRSGRAGGAMRDRRSASGV